MDKKKYVVVPKLLALILDAGTGEVAGLLDASELLTPESLEALSRRFGEVAEGAARDRDEERDLLERMYLLPARDVEKEREADPGA